MHGEDVKHSQLRKGDHHGCQIDETIQLEVSGDTPEGNTQLHVCMLCMLCHAAAI